MRLKNMLDEKNLIIKEKNPFNLFSKWYELAIQKELNDPNAMNLSTVSKKSKPSSRIVLLKSFNESGFVFYTNYKSKKGLSIISNPNVSLTFHWKSLMRQIRIEGKASLISKKEADDYFKTRPYESRIGAWASNQSKELKNRNELELRYKKFKKKFSENLVPRPENWVGFLVNPKLIEFWQQMPFRLHDRLEFNKKKSGWKIRKLYP